MRIGRQNMAGERGRAELLSDLTETGIWAILPDSFLGGAAAVISAVITPKTLRMWRNWQTR